jgi:hypothetical protein
VPSGDGEYSADAMYSQALRDQAAAIPPNALG